MCNAPDEQPGKPTSWGSSAITPRPATHKKVGALPVGDGEEVKQTHSIVMAIPLQSVPIKEYAREC
jgi:hypothetical protein